ncbi:MAG: hypothetical protein JSU05_01905 [Bacteroidetes bacterium]|nr:hypothetical protein [Bacteroidota bacterium]
MKSAGYLLLVCLPLFLSISSFSQKIIYSEPDKDDSRRTDFDIIGKIDGNFLIYKNIRDKSYLSVYNNDMEMTSKLDLDYVPTERLLNVDFFAYPDFAYMVYQYQHKNVVYCMAVKLNGSGEKVGEVMELDTSHISSINSNKIYNVSFSEDKSRIMIFKINTKNRRTYVLTTLLYNNKLEQLKRSVLYIPMEDHDEYLDEFHLDNDGDLVFSKFTRNSNDNIKDAAFIIKHSLSDSLQIFPLQLDKIYLDEIHIKVDNYNKRYLLTSFYYKERRGNVDGYYFYIWDKISATPVLENLLVFNDDLKKEARGDANTKMAFNDYFIRDIIVKRDGGFIVASESYYTTSRYNNWNRWNYLYGSPFISSYDYYSPFYNNFWDRYRYYNNGNSSVRYHADNIAILSFSKEGKQEWANVISKEQFDDESDNLISYQTMNTGGQLHFLFNQQEKRVLLLNDFAISPDGDITRNPTLKNLDRGYDFMTKFGKQVSAKQIIIPCLYRNYLCFAKVEYN